MINQRLAAARRLVYEAADSGLLSPELAAGIRRVAGVKHLGCRAGNWLNQDQAQLLLEKANGQIQFLLGYASVLTTERYLGCKQNLEEPFNDRFGCLFSGCVDSR